MTVSTEAGPAADSSSTAMSDASASGTTNAAATAAAAAAATTTATTTTTAAAPANPDEPASSIIVNVKQPAAPNFPPPKTDKPRPHVCTTCQRSFARLEHLKRHERSHTKEKPFECPECARCFARRDLLLRHQQKLHQTTTPASRPRNRRESASGVVAPGSRARKNSIASSTVSGAPNTMRPRANTISHIDDAHLSMITAANASVARGLPPNHHSRHPSLAGLPLHGMEHSYAGMAAAMGHRGLAHGLPKLDTHAMTTAFDPYSNGLRTAPPLAAAGFSEFDFDGIQLFTQGSTINPNALHYNDSPPSMALDPMSPFSHAMPDITTAGPLGDGIDWFGSFDHQLSFHNAHEHAIDGSSPSAISTTSQSALSDVMVDGSNQVVTSSVASTSFYQPAIMGPPQMTNPFGMDLHNAVFSDIMTGAPVSPNSQKNAPGDQYFSTAPATSLSSLSPTLMAGMAPGHSMNHPLNFAAGSETPSSINGSKNHGTTSPVSTITDSTRNAILGALSCGASQHSIGGSRFSFGPSTSQASDAEKLPSTADLQRYLRAYLVYFHPHLPFIHAATLSFDAAPKLGRSANAARLSATQICGPGCLLMSMATIGALYEGEPERSATLFEMSKRLIQLYLDERRKATVRKADSRRLVTEANGPAAENSVETPVWLVQAMLINVIYGLNCGDKRSGDIASTHVAALVSLSQGAELPRPVRIEPRQRDTAMEGADGGQEEVADYAEWITWKTMEEKKRTLFVIFILSSMLVNAYNHTQALTNSEILLDLPSDEAFFEAESPAAFNALGGVAGANHNRMSFHDALGELLQAKSRQQQSPAQRQNQPGSTGTAADNSNNNSNNNSNSGHKPFGSAVNLCELPKSELKPSTFGCLILIDALHNYIWETRQRHHNKLWTNEETEKMHRHIEPALRAWQAAWASNPQHSLERPNPYGAGPLSADAIPLLDLAYVRLFVDMSRTKEMCWTRDWEGLARELWRGSEIFQHAEHSPESNAESVVTSHSEGSAASSVFVDSPLTQSSSPDFASGSSSFIPGASAKVPPQTSSSSQANSLRREKHLRKAAFYAADSLSMSDKLGVSYADFTSLELPLQSAICTLDCSQVLAEWVATLQDRVGRYLGILGEEELDLGQVPAIMLLEDEDVKLLGKIQDVLNSAEIKMNLEANNNGGVMNGGLVLRMAEQVGYAAKILHVTAYMLSKAGAWPITQLMADCLDHHAKHMRGRAERSILVCD